MFFYYVQLCSRNTPFLCRGHFFNIIRSLGCHRILKRFCSQNQCQPKLKVTFIKKCGKRITTFGEENNNLLDVVVNNNVDIDGFGACEGTLACSTCHLIFKPEDYDRIGSKPTDEELDMLDLAFGLTKTSRLGCQVCLTKELDGLEVYVPDSVNDARNS